MHISMAFDNQQGLNACVNVISIFDGKGLFNHNASLHPEQEMGRAHQPIPGALDETGGGGSNYSYLICVSSLHQ